MKTIIELIAQSAKEDPERLCIVDKEGEHTYARIWNRVQQVAGRLQEMGIHKGNCVLAECTQNAKFLICNFACNLLGAYFVPVEHKASVDRIEEIRKEAEAALVISEDATKHSIRYDEIFTGNTFVAKGWMFPSEDDTAEILYTTGTTGKSKGIEITHRNNIAIAENIAFGTEMSQGNIELIPLPLSHSHGLRSCYANFYRQGTVVLTEGITKALEIYQLIKKYHITAMDLSPTAASVLLKLTRGRLGEFDGQFDYIQIGTAALPEDLKENLCRQFPNVRLYNFYGSTESGRSCALNFNSEADRKYCIGYPTRNATFIVTDEEHHVLRSDCQHTGLLACSGPMNMKGYWKQPDLTRQIMKDGFIYTNDEGYIDERGFVYVLGRTDDIINYKGIKIAPEEIEAVVMKYPGICDCACVPAPDKNAGQVPKLFLVLHDRASFDQVALARFLEEHIDANKIPKLMELIDEIPRTSNGKIRRKALISMHQ